MLPQRNHDERMPVRLSYLPRGRKCKALQTRVNSVQSVLDVVVKSNSMDRGFSGAQCWALVGGVLRDMLLAEPSLQLPIPLVAWNDIDVAVSKGDLTVSPDILQILESSINSFGGLKTYSALVGSIDMWSWPLPASEDSYLAWTQNLGKCDFGVNAVAYAWPLRSVIIHPQWLEDVNLKKNGAITIETLHRTASEPIHAVRGIALRSRLAVSHKSKQVTFGAKFSALIRDLTESMSASTLDEMRAYADYKIRQGKWSSDIVIEIDRLFGAA
jgi:hypothetical protein